MLGLCARYGRLARHRKRLLLATGVQLLVAAYWVQWQPFHRLVQRLGTQGHETAPTLTLAEGIAAREVAWAIAAIGRRLPFPPTCLTQAVAAKFLLDQQKIPSTLYIGVAPSTVQRGINAHAWLRCGQRVVTGKAEARQFKPMVWYG